MTKLATFSLIALVVALVFLMTDLSVSQWQGWKTWNNFVLKFSELRSDTLPPDTFDTAPMIVHTPPLSFEVTVYPSEIDSPDVRWLRLTLFDDCNLGRLASGYPRDITQTRKTMNVSWSSVLSDSSITFRKPVFYNYNLMGGIGGTIHSYWGFVDTTATTYLIVSLIDSSGNSISMDTVSCGDTISLEVSPRLDNTPYPGTEVLRNNGSLAYYNWDTTGVFPLRNIWLPSLVDSSNIFYIVVRGWSDFYEYYNNYADSYGEMVYSREQEPWFKTFAEVVRDTTGKSYSTNNPPFPSVSLLIDEGDSFRIATYLVVFDDSIRFSSKYVFSDWYYLQDTTTAPTDSVPISIENVGNPIPAEVVVYFSPRKIYNANPPNRYYNPYGLVRIYGSYVGFHSSDSVVLGVEDFDDLLTDSSQTYTHTPSTDIWVWARLYSPGGNGSLAFSYDSIVAMPADTTPPSIAGAFSLNTSPIHNIVLEEQYPVVSYDDDFAYFNVWWKGGVSESYVLIDTLHVFDNAENIRLPNNVFMYDSAFVYVTAVDTNFNETSINYALKDTLGFVPALIYITYLSGERGQPQSYWFYRNESDSVASDSIRIPASYVDTSLVDTCRVPILPVDTLVTAYYALRTITNSTLGVMSAWLKWPPESTDDNTPPEISGFVNVTFDSIRHLKFISSSVNSSSPDFNHFVIYFKARASDSYVSVSTPASISAGDRFAFSRTASYNDSGYVLITAVDDSSNESASAARDTFSTSPYYVVFKTKGGRRVDIDNVWIYLSKDSSAIQDSFLLEIRDIDTTTYDADTIAVPVSPPIDGYGRFYSGRSDSSGVLTDRSNWIWYPAPTIADTFYADSVAYDTVLVSLSGWSTEKTLVPDSIRIQHAGSDYPSGRESGSNLYAGGDTADVDNDKFPISGVGGTIQYFRVFIARHGEWSNVTASDTALFANAPSGGSCNNSVVLEASSAGATQTSFNSYLDTLWYSFQNSSDFIMDGDSIDVIYNGSDGGSGDSLVVYLMTDNSNDPGTMIEGTIKTYSYDAIPTTQQMWYHQFPVQQSLSANTTYWITITKKGTAFGMSFWRDGSNNYPNGYVKAVQNGGSRDSYTSWDGNFKVMGCE